MAGDKSRFSVEGIQSNIMKAAEFPGKVATENLAKIRGETITSTPLEKRNPVGEFIESNAVKGVVGSNGLIEAGAENLGKEGIPEKLLGGAQLIAGHLGKVFISLIGMAPTAVGKVAEFAGNAWNGITGAIAGKKEEVEQTTNPQQPKANNVSYVPPADTTISTPNVPNVKVETGRTIS
jgi:hypothetical protein